jgi:BlaI family transcriptional regulator, penicillinase repressor
MSSPRLGRVQMKIMQVLWEKGHANAREITDSLNESEPIAHSTVQTLLRKLEAKGAVRHDSQERTFVFYPMAKEDKVKRLAARDLMERVFGGSVAELVSYLLKNEKVPRDEIEQIHRLIDQQKRKGG